MAQDYEGTIWRDMSDYPILSRKHQSKRCIIATKSDEDGNPVSGFIELIPKEFSPNGTLVKIKGKWHLTENIRVIDTLIDESFINTFCLEVRDDPEMSLISVSDLKDALLSEFVENEDELKDLICSNWRGLSKHRTFGTERLNLLRKKLGLSLIRRASKLNQP